MDALRGRWSSDCARTLPGATRTVVDHVGGELLRRWREPHRRYHDVVHLAEVLAAVDAVCDAEHIRNASRSAALLGAWFHDAVYAVGTPDSNEERSAAYAADALGRLGAEPELIDRVTRLVRDTATHDLDGRVRDPARVALHDADLWILASPVGRFDEYCRQVRAEFSHIPAADYARARSTVLRPLLGRPHVYRSRHARSHWEPTARENLARELTRLAG